jgi:N-acyl-L-homoserine lactone synthetase
MYVVKVVEDEDERRDHERVRYEVYVREKRWVSESDAPGGRERDDLDAHSTLITAYDMSGEPAGAIRLIHRAKGSARPRLPVELNPFGCALRAARSAVEVSRLAVVHAHRGNSLVMLGLCRVAVGQMYDMRVDDCYAIVERPLLLSLQGIGFPFETLSEPVNYFGGLVAPVVAPVDQLVPGVVATGRFGAFFEQPFNGIVCERAVLS